MPFEKTCTCFVKNMYVFPKKDVRVFPKTCTCFYTSDFQYTKNSIPEGRDIVGNSIIFGLSLVTF